MKPRLSHLSLLLATGLAACPLLAQNEDALLDAARDIVRADREQVVTEALQLDGSEAASFWPKYHQYRSAMDKVADGLLELVTQYADLYPDVPEKQAKEMLKKMSALEQKLADTRASYMKKFAKILPAVKALRFAQVENRMDLALRLNLAASIPFVPMEGEMSGQAQEITAYEEGKAGGIVVRTVDFVARVAALDKAQRKVTLIDPDGIKKTVKVGPEAVNFDQIEIGDQLKVTATEELVIRMAEPGESGEDADAGFVGLAPVGAKPGGIIAGTSQVVGTVTGIDHQKRTATLQFADKSTRTFPVRDDLDLNQYRPGDRVVFQVTEMLAIDIEER